MIERGILTFAGKDPLQIPGCYNIGRQTFENFLFFVYFLIHMFNL